MTERKERLPDHHFQSVAQLKSDLRGRAIRGAGTGALTQAVDFVVQFAGTIILARILNPRDFGLVGMVVGIWAAVRITRNLGLFDATIQAPELDQGLLSTLFWINAGFGALLTLCFILLAPLIGWFYGEPEVTSIAMLMSLDFLFGGLSTQHRALLRRNLKYYRASIYQISGSLVGLIVAITMAASGWGYWALAMRRVASAAAEALMAWVLCPWRPGLPRRSPQAGRMFRFGINMIGSLYASFQARASDSVLIGWWHGTIALGLYDRGAQLFLRPVSQLTEPIANVAVATLSRLVDDPPRFRRYFINAVSFQAFFGFLGSAFLCLCGRDIVLALLGSKWEAAGTIVSVFGVAAGAEILYASHVWLHTSLGKPERLFRWSAVASVLTVLCFVGGLPYGPVGVAASYSVMLHVLLLTALWYAGKPIGLTVRQVVSNVASYALAAVVSGLAVWGVLYRLPMVSGGYAGLHVLVRIAVCGSLCTALYLVLLLAVWRESAALRSIADVLLQMIPLSKRRSEAGGTV